ncbi:hypothetical protein LJE86_07860 [bacterium BMS3Abin03]|jgi:hypothetical protein|nr:hypothetical protein [bacterium BMS3Abin03]
MIQVLKIFNYRIITFFTLVLLISKFNYAQIYDNKIVINFPIKIDTISFKNHPDFTDFMDVFFLNYTVNEIEYESYILKGSFKVSLFWDPYYDSIPVKDDTIYFYGVELKNLNDDFDLLFDFFKRNIFNDWIDKCITNDLIHCYDTKNKMQFVFRYSDASVGIYKAREVIEHDFPIEGK